MTSSENYVLRAARIFSGIRTITVIFNFTIAFLIILYAAFFRYRCSSLIHGILSSDFQDKNRSANMAARPDRQSVVMKLLLAQNKSFAIFAHIFSEKGVLKIRFVSYIRNILTYLV